jgi:hypothetical protein
MFHVVDKIHPHERVSQKDSSIIEETCLYIAHKHNVKGMGLNRLQAQTKLYGHKQLNVHFLFP